MSDPVADMIAAATRYREENAEPVCPDCGGEMVSNGQGWRRCLGDFSHASVKDVSRSRVPDRVALPFEPYVSGIPKPGLWILLEWSDGGYLAIEGAWQLKRAGTTGPTTTACQPLQSDGWDWTKYRRFEKLEPTEKANNMTKDIDLFSRLDPIVWRAHFQCRLPEDKDQLSLSPPVTEREWDQYWKQTRAECRGYFHGATQRVAERLRLITEGEESDEWNRLVALHQPEPATCIGDACLDMSYLIQSAAVFLKGRT